MPRPPRIKLCRLCTSTRVELPNAIMSILICPHCDYVCIRGESCLACQRVNAAMQ